MHKRLWLSAILCLAFHPWAYALRANKMESVDVTATVERAVANYKARELKTKNYAYDQIDLISQKFLKSTRKTTDLYEVIPLASGPYRRHMGHNGQPLAPEDELNEQKRMKKAIQMTDETFQEHIKDPKADFGDGTTKGIPIAAITIDYPVDPWQMDISSLPQGFSFQLLREETQDGQKFFVVEGKPTDDSELKQRGMLALNNFTLTLWISEGELEIVKLEARANRNGMLAPVYHAVVNPNEFKGAAAKDELNSLSESGIWYDRGIVITKEWKKLAGDGTWLPTSLHVKGKQSHEEDYWNGDHGSAAWPIEQQTTYYGYRKFQVNHRILPDFSAVNPGDQR